MTATSPAPRPMPRLDPDVTDLVERVAEIAAMEGWTAAESACDDIRCGVLQERDIEGVIEHYALFERLGLTRPEDAAEKYGVRS